MKPLALKIQAFGPFSGAQHLDFSELGENPLFLISGATGSGKTTILDAICFALYGGSSGDLRNPKDMRSDHADGATVTEVVFDFALGDRSYRVHRVPEQERPKLRGDGTTTQKSEADLWDRTGCDEGAEGSVLASGWTRVTGEVENLIGFHSEQFRQVIMLPQGKFRDLLDAKSQEREEILEQLFPTEIYGLIQDALKERAKTIQERKKALDDKRATLLEHHTLEDETGLAARSAEVDGEIERLRADLDSRETEWKAANDALNTGRVLEGHFSDLEKAAEEKKELETQTGEINEKRVKLRQAEAASGLSDLFAQLQRARKAVGEARQDAEESQSRLQDAKTAFETARSTLEKEEGRAEEREELSKGVSRLDDFRKKVEPLREAVELREGKEKALKDAQETEEAARQEVPQLEEAATASKKTLETTKEAAGRLGEWEEKLESSRKSLQDRRDLETAGEDFSNLVVTIEALEDRGKATAKELGAVEAEFKRAREIWEKGQAAILAQGMEPGAPCPVCGSTHHPSPATSEEEIPSEEDLKAYEESLEQARERKGALDGKLTAARTESRGLEEKVAGLKKRLGSDAGVNLETFEAQHGAIEAEHAAALTAKGAVDDLLEESLREGRSLEAGEKTLREAVEATSLAKKALEMAETLVKEREAGIPEEHRDPERLERTFQEKSRLLQDAQEALNLARKAKGDTEVEMGKAEKTAESAAKALKKAEEVQETDDKHWVDRRTASGFSTEQEYLDALLEADERETLRQAIDQHKESLLRVEAEIKKNSKHIGKKERPDIPRLEELEREAEGARSDLRDRWTKAKGERAELEKLRSDLATIAEKSGDLEKQYGIVGRLSDVANSRSMTFQRYVLAALLDDVLLAASVRLELMSRGRYRLMRRMVQADKRSHAGLDLDVEDTYTGKARPVSTLSGGESFQAALSLAMGLAEVVQSYAGGIRLDTIFVDEGFGSLDPEALDSAVKALVDLQQAGRMVGVISHVPELKERIDVRLEVQGSRSGSTAGFVVP